MSGGIEAIRTRLLDVARRYSVYDGSEIAEAKSFIDLLFAAYGTDRFDAGAKFEDRTATGGFIDCIWPGVCIFEMKRPSETAKLDSHWKQAYEYWENSADAGAGIKAPPYVVLCSFRRLLVYTPRDYPKGPPVIDIDLVELPERPENLLFLAREDPRFTGTQAELTREAVEKVVEVFHLLDARGEGSPDERRDFILQNVWSMFAEDLGLIPDTRYTSVLDHIRTTGASSWDVLGDLFEWLNRDGERPRAGMYKDVPYANGGLFERPVRLHLEPDEIDLLRTAADHDWKQVQPAIFGKLLEGALAGDQQQQLGAHYTHEADIYKIVEPVIVRPWRERIDAIGSVKDAQLVREELMHYRVLDPACGSGNFLYVAYRELRRLEQRLNEREATLRRDAGMPEQVAMTFFPITNMLGIELNGFAVRLARVTLWMAHKLAVEEFGIAERTLPLAPLTGIREGDALWTDWPECDAIIGNPPFHGSQHLRSVLGDAYVERLKTVFDCGVKDLCVYWYRKVHDHLQPGQRAGLVGTNSVSSNRGRSASLDYIVDHGGVITDAVSTQPWPGDAAVHVSIASWIKQPAETIDTFMLDGSTVASISTRLDANHDEADPLRLSANARLCFQGPQPVGKGFILETGEALAIIRDGGERYRDVVRPYLVGQDIAGAPGASPTRWIIDFAVRPLEEAEGYELAMQIVRQRVKPERDRNRERFRRENWWMLGRPVGAMRSALAGKQRYIAVNALGKRIFFVWADAAVCPSNRAYAIAFDDDYSMGILSSSPNRHWTERYSSRLEDRLAYTPQTTFETFPWPTPTDAQRDAITDISRRLVARRDTLSSEHQLGLTKLYNKVDDGGFTDLKALHAELDAAVCAAYGWPASVASDPAEVTRRLLELNAARAAAEAAPPVASPA